jgi:predicted 3-demethylubiquinone-9 3-methyltransferase (glyoxalase superfamily)
MNLYNFAQIQKIDNFCSTMKTAIQIFYLSLITISCSALKTSKNHYVENENKFDMKQKIITFLTFQKNDAEQAMNLYVGLFDNSKIIDLKRWGKDGPGNEGAVMHATFELNGQKFMCSDSPPVHNWDFTPAVSIYVECENEEELEKLFSKLSENGAVAMPLDNYGFSQKFGWVVDRFGVSWQLNLQ